MHQPALMRCVQAGGDLAADAQDVLHGERPLVPFQPILQRFAA
jgi:hypothetical protein